MAPADSMSCDCSSAHANSAEEPIVCTLGGAAQSTRTAEFKAVFAYLTRTEAFDNGFRWFFKAEPELEARLRDLAQREHECCRFFEFRVSSEDDSVVWEARTNERARAVLEELMRLPETLSKSVDVADLKRAINARGLTFSSDADDPSP